MSFALRLVSAFVLVIAAGLFVLANDAAVADDWPGWLCVGLALFVASTLVRDPL